MVVPTVQFIKFDKTVDPSGFRNIVASGQIVDTSITGCLDFGNINTSVSGGISDTAMLVFRVDDLGSASGIYNMKFYLDNSSSFSVGNYRFLQKINTHYQGPSFSLSLADNDVATLIPGVQNVIATNGQPVLSGITDSDVSQYIYLAVYADNDVPFGTYGGCAAGSFRYRMVFDFS